jgi:hypothetical protein
MEDKIIINQIIEAIKTSGEDMSDGEVLDEIVRIIETGYKIEWGFR